MSELIAFQDAFVAALDGDGGALSAWLESGTAAPGLIVYRNTIAKGCVEALAANFPTVLAVTGEEWFRGAALLFSRLRPPAHAALHDYGETFAHWLESFPPAGELPYLPSLARMDRLWIEALFAEDATPLDAASLAPLSPEVLASARLGLNPSLRMASFDFAAPDLWRAVRAGETALELGPDPQTLLIVRHAGIVLSRNLHAGEAAFMRAVQQGETLGRAAERAARAKPDAALANLFAALIADGVFTQLNLDIPR